MKSAIILFLFCPFVAIQQVSAMTIDYLCEGENDEHHFSISVNVNGAEIDFDFLQKTQNINTPYPLLPIRHIKNDLSPEFRNGFKIYRFSFDSYQSCSYRWLWPDVGAETLEVYGDDEIKTSLKLDCDGVKSQAEIFCEIEK